MNFVHTAPAPPQKKTNIGKLNYNNINDDHNNGNTNNVRQITLAQPEDDSRVAN